MIENRPLHFLEPKSCKEYLNVIPSLSSGTYTINPTGTNPIKVYCDMGMHGGGWTLVWSYTFTAYNSFGSNWNAVTPAPSWPIAGNQRQSNTPPLSETDYEAMPFYMWKLVGGREV